MDVACLSLRSPLKTACRIEPALVHSPNATSATSVGLSQCALRSISRLGANGLLSAANLSIFAFRSRKASPSKPLPTLPA